MNLTFGFSILSLKLNMSLLSVLIVFKSFSATLLIYSTCSLWDHLWNISVIMSCPCLNLSWFPVRICKVIKGLGSEN